MIFGQTHDNIKFDKYLSPNFVANTNNQGIWNTCGSATLSLLTGKSAEVIEKSLPKNQIHWSGTAATNYLKKHNYFVKQLTKISIMNHKSNGNWESDPVKPNHVLLCQLRVDLNEASWFVMHKGKMWHNHYEVDDVNSLTLINFWPQNIWLISHKKWC